MRFGTKIFTILLMLFVLTGQVMAASSVSSCDMNMSQMDMSDHSNMGMSHADMNNNKMDCCDNSCVMDCSISMVLALIDTTSFEVLSPSSAKIALPVATLIIKSSTTFYHPPISA